MRRGERNANFWFLYGPVIIAAILTAIILIAINLLPFE